MVLETWIAMIISKTRGLCTNYKERVIVIYEKNGEYEYGKESFRPYSK